MKIKIFPCLLSCLLLFVSLLINSFSVCAEDDQYVYYGYVPIGTDVGWPGTPDPTLKRALNDIIDGKTQTFIPPEGTALLDIIGIYEDTEFQIWDILANKIIASATLNRLEKQTFFIKFGTFFKVISSKKVAVFISGGYCMWAGYHENRMGTMLLYPSSEGGFIGDDFVFMSSMCSDTYIAYKAGYNLYIAALEKTDIKITSSSGKDVLSASLDQYGVGKYYLNCRIGIEQPTFGGGGDSMIFHMKSTGKIIASCVTSRSFIAVPCVTGGFVGRMFYAPVYLTIEEPGSAAAFVIVPIEPGEVKVYDSRFNIIGERTFTQEDIDKNIFWFRELGSFKGMLLFKSTCDMTVMVGCTYLGSIRKDLGPEDFGDDVTFLGAKANQLIRFYAPSHAILFSPKDCSAIIDGEVKSLKKDSFILLEQGVHSVKADAEVIVQILSVGHPVNLTYTDPDTGNTISSDYYWTDWGSYLISPADINVSLKVPEGFGETEGGVNVALYSAITVAIIGLILGILAIKKKSLFRRK